jgi:S-formylglutathione hydrolase FrmB
LIRSSTLSILFSALFLLSACSHSVKAKPDHPRLATGVTLRDIRFFSRSLDREMTYRVFLPAEMPPGRKFPVVYLLHGAWTDFRDWSNSSNVSEYARKGVILVMPEGDLSYYANAANIPKGKYEDYMTIDLIADVEGRFPVKRNRADRAIVGVSMGGFGAVDYALRHPDLYFFAGALSPSIDILRRHFSLRHVDQWLRTRRIFGASGSEERLTHDPFDLVRTVDPRKTPYIYLTVGESEPLFEPNERFSARLQQGGFPHEFHTKPGAHDWGQWNTQLPGCFESLFAHLDLR